MNGVRVGGDDRPRIVVCGDKMRSVMANDKNGNCFLSAPTIGTISRFDTTSYADELDQTWKTGDEYVDQSIAFNRAVSENFCKSHLLFTGAKYSDDNIPTIEFALPPNPSDAVQVVEGSASNMSYAIGLHYDSSGSGSFNYPSTLIIGPAGTFSDANETIIISRMNYPSGQGNYCYPSNGVKGSLPNYSYNNLRSQTDFLNMCHSVNFPKEGGTDENPYYSPDMDVHVSVNYLLDFEFKKSAIMMASNNKLSISGYSQETGVISPTVGFTIGGIGVSTGSEQLYNHGQVTTNSLQGRAIAWPSTYAARVITNDKALNLEIGEDKHARALIHFDMVAKQVGNPNSKYGNSKYIYAILPYVGINTSNWVNFNGNDGSVKIKLKYSWLSYACANMPDGTKLSDEITYENKNRTFGMIYDNDGFRRPEHHTVATTGSGEYVDFIEYGNLAIGLHGNFQSGVTFSVYTKDDAQTQIRVSSIEILNDACPTKDYDFSNFGFIGQHSIVPTTPEAPYQHSTSDPTVHNSGISIYTYTNQVLQAGSTVTSNRAKLFSDIKITYNGGRLYHLRVVKEPDTTNEPVRFRYWIVYADPKLEDPPASTT